ncbi:MAG: hypothetical protein AABX48_02000 [Nanoarchaeota archaeon]
MKTRKNVYKLHKLDVKDYDGVASILRSQSMFNSSWPNETEYCQGMGHTFLMPGGKVRLDMQIFQNVPALHVTRTSLFEPLYVRRIVKRFGGELRSESEYSNPDQRIDDFVTKREEKEKYMEFVRNNVRAA